MTGSFLLRRKSIGKGGGWARECPKDGEESPTTSDWSLNISMPGVEHQKRREAREEKLV
jgi:hypothetical protein